MAILAETFHLPNGEDYDDLVTGLDDDIQDEGGANFFLGMMRDARRDRITFHKRTLEPLAHLALSMELMKPESNITVDKEHRLANAALSGMLFGNFMNEGFYPRFNQEYLIYNEGLNVYSNMVGDMDDVYTAEGRWKTVQGRRIGYLAVSRFIVGQFSDEALTKVNSWSEDLIPNPDFRPYFLQGVGMALYSSWDVYSELMYKDGRADEVLLPEDLVPDTVDDNL